jgi:DNA-binding NtrC family response regulator
MFPKIPVIVLTAYGSPDVKAECFSQGAAAFLEKPLDMPQLLDVVENVLAAPEPVATASTSEKSETGSHSPARKLKSESHPKEKERTPHEHNQ